MDLQTGWQGESVKSFAQLGCKFNIFFPLVNCLNSVNISNCYDLTTENDILIFFRFFKYGKIMRIAIKYSN